jgi:menaquinone-dependent protoporphyrinogen oxidase
MNVLVLFASRHGHTRRIAEAIGATLRKRGWDPELHDVATDLPAPLSEYSAAILVSPIHLGRHAKRIVAFARRHRQALDVLPSAFVSVSLTQTTAESATATTEQRRQAHEDLSVALGHFIEATGWAPRDTLRVAGALAYTRYNWFVRWMMKRIAKAQGGSSDTSRDHVYTDWDALEQFTSEFADRLHRTSVEVAAMAR